MQIDIGCFYFIKDEFFDIIDDKKLMKNKENMFPVTEGYIESQYIKNKVAITLSNKLQTEIINKVNKVLNLYNHGMKNIIFPDIDSILKRLI